MSQSEEKKVAVSRNRAVEADEDILTHWLQQLGQHAGTDTLLYYAPTPANSIDLTHAHPSGLAQLLTGRRTRISTLLRDPAHYGAAMKTARALRAKIFELGNDRGIDVGYLAAGTASWRVPDVGRSEALYAPVMLIPIALTVRPSQDDYELQLMDKARLNPAMVRHLRHEQGIDIDPDAVARLAYSTARFDPHPVLDRLRALTEDVRSMTIEHHLLVSTFADVAHTAAHATVEPDHPVLNALMAAEMDPETEVHIPVPETGLPPLDERAPQDEFLVLDADSAQQDVLDLVQEGHSLVVSAPPGTGQTQTALNAAALLAYEGKSVLVVAERRATLNQFAKQLDDLKLGSMVLQLNPNLTGQQLKDQLVRAIIRNEKAAAPQLEKLHSTLAGHRHQLQDHVKSLHNVRKRWNCSPYQAMQSLAKLTSLDPAPATTVRLKRSVLDSITDRAELTGRLRRAAELGSFSKASTTSPWFGAKLHNRKETEDAHELAAGLARDLPELRTQMERAAELSNIALGVTFREWGEQLLLLVSVRSSLDKFTPDIFDRPVTDLISATASSGWRRERGIEMSSMTRSRLRRVAKEYVRPGVHIADLHQSLIEVQEQRTQWTDYATTQRHPSVPSGLAELNGFYLDVRQRLGKLGSVLAEPGDVARLMDLELGELASHLESLAGDRETLVHLPERTLLLEQMREQGLGELLDDLAEREVDAAAVGSELDLAWWQSALEAMISGDDYLAMSDGDNLRKLEAVYRLADNAHIASGPARLRWELAQNWRDAIKSKPKTAERLRELLKSGDPTLAALNDQSGSLLTTLVPVWAASPLVLPAVLPAGQRFDAVIILDAEATSLQSAVGAICRATQIIAFGDGQLGSAEPFEVNVDRRPAAGGADQPEPLISAFHALERVLPVLPLTTAYRAVDLALAESLSEGFYGGSLTRLPSAAELTGGGGLTVEYLPDGTGLPGAGHEGVESVPAEISRVVDMVFEHARLRPARSLAVVTATLRHAARIGEAIRLQLPNHPDAAEFFQRADESFRVVPVERASGLVRDDIIFSLGYGRTPHGRAVHNFGPLSEPDGRNRFAMAMTRARHNLHVLTCFRPEDLDADRLSHGAADFLELISRAMLPGYGQKQRFAAGIEDPLVADLVERIRSHGARVKDHYHGVLDIVAAADPDHVANDRDPGLPVALESDGTEQYLNMTVRERSRLRPQQLERLGWRPLTLWTIEVFTDPNQCARLIGGYLGLREPDEAKAGRRTSPAAARADEAPKRPFGAAGRDGEAPAHDHAAKDAAAVPEDGAQPAGGGTPSGADGGDSAEVSDSSAGAEGADSADEADGAAEGGDEAVEAGAGEASDRREMLTRKALRERAIPAKAAEDDPRSWGEREQDRDAWLKEQRPPHWG
ncbi:DUF4011 domain-containing protein [Arthrobacter mangrovi]|uniref:AAA family ATPase n=1 Tax=Arthrobacter mangrovi TaxID=2966350 RepID=A0ABQ5MSU4_9MICC|nr:DUF4011 domain-containing protein [Arthrobacter mangrovi]GLB67059.1 hypothetical protein AHIS1636_14980 [Arthrobacter mangrovi]